MMSPSKNGSAKHAKPSRLTQYALFVLVFALLIIGAYISLLATREGGVGISYLEDIKALINREVRLKVTAMQQYSQLSTAKTYPEVITLPESRRLRILVTGGAGFVGSHLVDR